jgi:hypothetical protein
MAYSSKYHTHPATLITGVFDGNQLPPATALKPGAVPPLGGTGKFLKDDGTWATPAGGGGGLTLPQVLTAVTLGF